MMRSMFSGVSGLRAHQIKMDVIGNNIANVNTIGFKSSRVTFQEIYNQTIKPSSAPSNISGRGGTNPVQIGLGVSVGSIDVLHTRGNVQRTDKATDLAIEGDGFFTVSEGANTFYTRAGNFDVDRQGNIITASGLKVLGWSRDAKGNIDTSKSPAQINLANLSMPPEATSKITFNGNLDDKIDKNGGTYEYAVTVFDSKGSEHVVNFKFTRKNNDEWSWKAECGTADLFTKNDGTVTFNSLGKLTDSTGEISFTPKTGADNINIKLVFDKDKFTQFDDETSVKVGEMDGVQAGTLSSITIDSSGRVIGIYSNGQMREEAVLAIAKFNNPAGLTKLGDNLFMTSNNSGIAELQAAGVDGRGSLNPGALEMSNVDLASEFTEMITAQRGFQANSRIITTSDELLQELVNLKR